MKIKMVPIDQIKVYERNAKKHPTDQIKKIAASLKATGWDQPIVVDKDYIIIKGHGRRLAAIALEMKEVPVLVRDDLTPDQVKAARLADNRVALSGIDSKIMKLELASLSPAFLDGIYDAKELEFIVMDLGRQSEGVFVPDVDLAVADQEAEAKKKADASLEARVSLAKAFGFKDVAGADEIYFSRFMARIESESGLSGADALVHFLKKLVE